MLKYIAKIFVFVSVFSAIGSAFNLATAARVDGLYDVEILVADETRTTREQSFRQGLDEVFVRISGDSIVMDKLKRPSASRYVKQFSYEPVEKPTTNKAGELLTHNLKIQYNGSAMQKYLLDKNFPAWGEYRPDVVIWLVVRDGRNEYVLRDTDQSALKTAVADALSRRGIPNRWPVYDKKDKTILGVSDIRGGFKEPVVKASQRYSRGPALTGSMIWNGKQWQSNWSLLLKGENRHWNLDDVDHSRLINHSIDQAADALGVVFAVHSDGNKRQLLSVLLDVQSVNDIRSYRYLENYLTNLSAVDRVKPYKVDGTNAVFEVVLRSKEEDFISLIKNDSELTEVEPVAIKIQEDQAHKDNTPENKIPGTGIKGNASPETNVRSPGESKPDAVIDKDTLVDVPLAQDVALKDELEKSTEHKSVHYYSFKQPR